MENFVFLYLIKKHIHFALFYFNLECIPFYSSVLICQATFVGQNVCCIHVRVFVYHCMYYHLETSSFKTTTLKEKGKIMHVSAAQTHASMNATVPRRKIGK